MFVYLSIFLFRYRSSYCRTFSFRYNDFYFNTPAYNCLLSDAGTAQVSKRFQLLKSSMYCKYLIVSLLSCTNVFFFCTDLWVELILGHLRNREQGNQRMSRRLFWRTRCRYDVQWNGKEISKIRYCHTFKGRKKLRLFLVCGIKVFLWNQNDHLVKSLSNLKKNHFSF